MLDNRRKLIIFSLMILTLCSGCVSEGVFRAEKLLWRADYKWNKIFQTAQEKQDDKISDKQINDLIYAYKEITLRYPFWQQTYQAHFKLAKLYALRNNNEKALQEYALVCKDFALQPEICAKALKNTAQIYEMQNNWPKAEDAYKRIIDEYLNSSVGLLVPLYLAKQYQRRGEDEKAQEIFSLALAHYQKIIVEKDNALGTLGSIDFAVVCFLNTKTPQDAVDFLNSLKNEYPNSLIEVRALWNLAQIYHLKINDAVMAKKYYQEIADKYPQINLAQKAKEQIKILTEDNL